MCIHYHCTVYCGIGVGWVCGLGYCVHTVPLYSVLWDRGWVGLEGSTLCIHYHCTVYCGVG